MSKRLEGTSEKTAFHRPSICRAGCMCLTLCSLNSCRDYEAGVVRKVQLREVMSLPCITQWLSIGCGDLE